MFVNWALSELNLKIVYYGPALSGKTTNLQQIHDRTPDAMRGRLISLKTQQERTLLFDFLQLELGIVRGLKPKFKLYTVPGQTYYAQSRRLILQGVDGIVFVADSQAGRMAENQECWFTMEQHLIELGHNVARFPIVVQFNKRDLPHAVPTHALRRPFPGRQCFEATASSGTGVLETLKAIMTLTIAQMHESTATTS
jgi:mutual gliding-motility protein MglA